MIGSMKTKEYAIYDSGIDKFLTSYKDKRGQYAIDWRRDDFFFVMIGDDAVDAILKIATHYANNGSDGIATSRADAVSIYLGSLKVEELAPMFIVPVTDVEWMHMPGSRALGAATMMPDFMRADRINEWI